MQGEQPALRGAIDGCLSVLGVVIGAYGVDPSFLFSAALAGNLANSMSNLLAAFSSASAQRATDLRLLERSMLTELRGTEPEQMARRGARVAAVLDGLATLAGGFVPVAPFLFLTGATALMASIAASLLVMLVLGAWVGRFSHEGMYRFALKLAGLSLLTALACLLIHRWVAPAVLPS